MNRSLALVVIAVLAALPALVLRALGAHADHGQRVIAWPGGALSGPWAALVFGVGVLAGAFLVSWAAELMQLELSQSFAMALIALLAVLPEYTVDIYLAYTAATIPENAPLALANMTGANRLLIGIGWPMVAIALYMTTKRREVTLESARQGELFFLALATGYSFAMVFKSTLSLWDTLIFLVLFALYARFVMRQEVVEPELEGPAAAIARLAPVPRRIVTGILFAVAGLTLLAAAEPFAEGLKFTGTNLGVSEFLLIQWIAPLASEAPEFLIVMIFALRGQATAGFGALVSSKVNQWTLLVGMVPLAYALGLYNAGQPLAPLHLDPRQLGEVLLTAAQSALAVLIVIDRRFRTKEAYLLAGLFLAQLAVSIGIESASPLDVRERLFAIEKGAFTAIYLVLALIMAIRHRRDLVGVARFVWNEERRRP